MSPRKKCCTYRERGQKMVNGGNMSSSRRLDYISSPPPTDSARPSKSPERTHSAPDPSSLCFNKDSKLAQQLLARLKASQHAGFGNITRKDLGGVLSFEAVQHELKGLAGKRIARETAEQTTTPGHDCQGIFAILVLLKQTPRIFGILNQTFPTIPTHHQDCGLSDHDLPLVVMYDESKSKVVLRRRDYPEAHLDCFDELTPEEILAFEQWQWSVLGEEHFEDLISDGASRRCETWHYQYHPNDQLPVIQPKEPPDSALAEAMIGKDIHRVGSNGAVSPWMLADPTRSRPIPDGAGNFHQKCRTVAVKQSRNAKSFFSERRAAALISAVAHPHLVPLLFSFSHLEKFCLVFPWATSNLAEFWENNQLYLQDMLTMEYARVMWVAEQCEGLADALRCIHRFVSISKDGTTTRLVPSHHGDIKPENILVFCRPHRPPVLQLADFGKSTYATVFNNKRPVMDVDHSAGDYTAPEVYFGEPVSSNSDVWSLCCVFLDFIEWIMPSQSAPGQPRRVLSDLEEKGIYVQGREAVRDWRRSRVGIGCVDEARYFFDTGTGEPNIWVDTWLHDAQDNPLCSNWMCAFVGFLDEYILQQEANDRISSRALYAMLRDLRMSCQHPVEGRRFAVQPIHSQG